MLHCNPRNNIHHHFNKLNVSNDNTSPLLDNTNNNINKTNLVMLELVTYTKKKRIIGEFIVRIYDNGIPSTVAGKRVSK